VHLKTKQCSFGYGGNIGHKITFNLLFQVQTVNGRTRLKLAALTLSNPIFLPPAYFPAVIYFGRERGWWVSCNYPAVLKREKHKQKQKEYNLRYLLAKVRTT
jgi:hypothetical protein